MKNYLAIIIGSLLFASCIETTKHDNNLANVAATPVDLPYKFKSAEAEQLSIEAFALKDEEKFSEAVGLYKKAIAIEPDNPKLYFDMAECYASSGSVNEAIGSMDKAIELDSSYPAFYSNRGLYYYYIYQNERAIHDLGKAVALDSTNPGFFYNLSIAYYASNKFGDACKAFKRSQRLGLKEEGISGQTEYTNLQKICGQ